MPDVCNYGSSPLGNLGNIFVRMETMIIQKSYTWHSQDKILTKHIFKAFFQSCWNLAIFYRKCKKGYLSYRAFIRKNQEVLAVSTLMLNKAIS